MKKTMLALCLLYVGAKAHGQNSTLTVGSLSVGGASLGNHSGYVLAVQGNILAQQLQITQTGWPDYVFEAKYRLMSPHDLESYIKINKHLPGAPAAQDVEKNGLDVGSTEAVLLKKIEELTLYMIGQDKQLEALRLENAKMEEQLKLLTANRK